MTARSRPSVKRWYLISSLLFSYLCRLGYPANRIYLTGISRSMNSHKGELGGRCLQTTSSLKTFRPLSTTARLDILLTRRQR